MWRKGYLSKRNFNNGNLSDNSFLLGKSRDFFGLESDKKDYMKVEKPINFSKINFKIEIHNLTSSKAIANLFKL